MDTLHIQGLVKIYEGKKEKLLVEYKNLVTYQAKKHLLKFLMGFQESGGINYLAIGDGQNANGVLPTDYKLENEMFRKQISSTYLLGDTRIVFETFIEPSEANNFTWLELALFADGEGSKDSGICYNKVKVSDPNLKNDAIGRTIIWEVVI